MVRKFISCFISSSLLLFSCSYPTNAAELSEIDKIFYLERLDFVKATVTENFIDNKINLNFNIEETEKPVKATTKKANKEAKPQDDFLTNFN